MGCIYCGKRLVQPAVKDQNKDFHLKCYLKNGGSKIFTKSELDEMARRLDVMGCRIEFLAEICDNALDNKSSLEEQKQRFHEICARYEDLSTGKRAKM